MPRVQLSFLAPLASLECRCAAIRPLGCLVRTRLVVLVDVYLPIAVWSGLQFQRSSGALVVALFKHVSCNSETRSSLLLVDENSEAYPRVDTKSIWSCADCHVLGCVNHCLSFGSGTRRSFDLHEIFKSLPTAGKGKRSHSTRIKPDDASVDPGIWDISEDVLIKVLLVLCPTDLIRVAASYRHFRILTSSIMPCMKLKLFAHQEAAVEWMLKRERNTEVLSHPTYMSFSTDDGFSLYINAVSGEISTGVAPTIYDFHGGMFCDEPGLGKTVIALSLILKTHGTFGDPPPRVNVVWCMRDASRRCGYYELSADNFTFANFMSTWKRFMGQNTRRGKGYSSKLPLGISSVGNLKSSSRCRQVTSTLSGESVANSVVCKSALPMPTTCILRCTRILSRLKKNLLDTYETNSDCNDNRTVESSSARADNVNDLDSEHIGSDGILRRSNSKRKRQKKDNAGSSDASAAWFCRMNTDPLRQSCAAPEEPWHQKRKITYLPGFIVFFFFVSIPSACSWACYFLEHADSMLMGMLFSLFFLRQMINFFF